MEWVARETMFVKVAAGARAVPCLSVKALCLFVAYQCRWWWASLSTRPSSLLGCGWPFP